MAKKPKKSTLSEVMAWLGSRKSEKKAEACRRNSKLAGRPINPNSERQKRLKRLAEKNAKEPIDNSNG